MPGQKVPQRKFQKDWMYIILLTKTALLHRIKVGVRIKEYYIYISNVTEFLNFLLQQEVLINDRIHLHCYKETRIDFKWANNIFLLYLLPLSWYCLGKMPALFLHSHFTALSLQSLPQALWDLFQPVLLKLAVDIHTLFSLRIISYSFFL